MNRALLRRAAFTTLVLFSLLIALVAQGAPARAAAGMIHGKVVDSVTPQPIQDGCVYLGIPGTSSLCTTVEISFYKFSDGSCVERYVVNSMAPGTSHANNPNDPALNPSLPDDAQFSVVVQGFGSKIVGVVNEHMGTGDRAEALSYDGFT